MICLGDMSLLEPADYRELADAFAARPRGSIVVPHRGGMRGNPVVFAADHAVAVIAWRYARLLERLALSPVTVVS